VDEVSQKRHHHKETELRMLGVLHHMAGKLELQDGHPEAALRHLSATEAGPLQQRSPYLQFQVMLAEAVALGRTGQASESLEWLRRAEKLLEGSEGFETPARRVQYLAHGADVHLHLRSFEEASGFLAHLRHADKAAAEQDNRRTIAEMRARFDLQSREQDNELLRARQHESEARGWLLSMALIGCVALMAGLGAVLRWQTKLKRRFAMLALRDELTTLPNRRSVMEAARAQVNGRRDTDARFHIALLDIDHFKQINDTHGHDAGDRVLQFFAATCSTELRATDVLGRWGGEEFLLVLPRSDPALIGPIFERLQRAVHQIALPGIVLAKPLNFSMGAAQDSPGETLEAMIQRVDDVLYIAKRQGRDRWALSPAPSTMSPVSASAQPRASVDQRPTSTAGQERDTSGTVSPSP
jgi:diguanylate cyclase (GGDEF)-like protein